MLIIRKEQMDVFEKYATSVFNNKMISHLRNAYPEQTSAISDEDLSVLVQGGSEKAEFYGIVEDSDVQHFLGYMVLYGADFDSDRDYPEVQEILNDFRMDGEEKIDLIELCFQNSEES